MKATSTRSPFVCTALSLLLLGGCACNQKEVATPVAEPAPVAAAPASAPTTTTASFTVSAEELFDFDKASLRADATADLDAAIAKYRGNAALVSMTIAGHTDSTGSDAYNQNLSERRAAAVRDYLVSQGIDAARISASGKGESNPIATNDTAEGRQKNRRVEISAAMQREVTR